MLKRKIRIKTYSCSHYIIQEILRVENAIFVYSHKNQRINKNKISHRRTEKGKMKERKKKE